MLEVLNGHLYAFAKSSGHKRRAEPDGDGALALARQAERLVTENRDGG
jgi:hypothetical protein